MDIISFHTGSYESGIVKGNKVNNLMGINKLTKLSFFAYLSDLTLRNPGFTQFSVYWLNLKIPLNSYVKYFYLYSLLVSCEANDFSPAVSYTNTYYN